MKSSSRKSILITGATSGFGKAIAQKFAGEGYDVIATGRRADRLQTLKLELETKNECSVYTLSFDVSSELECKTVLGDFLAEYGSPDILVNNAGLASGFDKFQDGLWSDWMAMIDTNVKGLMMVSRLVVPGMIESGQGHIINIGSTASREVYEKGNVYCASKHAVEALTKGMRIDLLGTGVKVTQISPGAADTEFSLVRFHGDEDKAKSVYKGYQPMTAKDIADVTFYTTTLPAHLCINDVVLTSVAQANSYYIRRD
jgi:3-hydroxy acid dehydrogenase / malonic semialdehyde reductase